MNMSDPLSREVDAVLAKLSEAGERLQCLRPMLRLATKSDVQEIMSTLREFIDGQTAFNASLETTVDNLVGDVQSLKALIEKLQNSPGSVTPDDQSLIDQIQAKQATILSKVQALDAQTENLPEPPVEPPVQ